MISDPAPASVLIVEDDAMVLATLKVTLERERFRVTTSTQPVEALKILADNDFSVIISDQRMPEMTGLDFLVECRRRRPHSSRILLTAVTNLTTVVDAINRGEICRFIGKPWLREELVAAVRDAVQRHDLAVHNHETARLNQQLMEANRALEAKLSELESRQPA